jgi:hypothetical protein
MGTLAAYVSASVFSGFTLVGVLDRQLSEYGRLPAGAGGVPLRRRNVCPARPCMLGRCARGAAASQSVDNSEQYVSTVLVGRHGSYARSPWLGVWER